MSIIRGCTSIACKATRGARLRSAELCALGLGYVDAFALVHIGVL